MCRMILGLGIKRNVLEYARKVWDSNPHGWGITYYHNNEIVEWHTNNSDVPIPIYALPMKFNGLFHIRYATVKTKYGGVHPFVKGEMMYAHNGTIYPFNGEIDSQTIGKYADGENLKEKMLSAIRKLNDEHTGWWNIIAMEGEYAFGYCDGSLVKVFDESGNIVALMSDEKPLKRFPQYKAKSMVRGEWTYLQFRNGVWEEIEIGKEEKKIAYRKVYEENVYDWNWNNWVFPNVHVEGYK